MGPRYQRFRQSIWANGRPIPYRTSVIFGQSGFKVEIHQIADEDRRISTLYDMLDAQDATNRDAKGLPFTVRNKPLNST